MSTLEYCTFFLNGLEFGVPVSEVREVIRCQPLTRVPLCPPTVEGLMNVRGEIVTAINLRRRLGLPEMPASDPPVNVVMAREDGALSLLVDDVGDVITVRDDAIDPAPVTLRGPDRNLVAGVYQQPERLLIIIDTKATLDGIAP